MAASNAVRFIRSGSLSRQADEWNSLNDNLVGDDASESAQLLGRLDKPMNTSGSGKAPSALPPPRAVNERSQSRGFPSTTQSGGKVPPPRTPTPTSEEVRYAYLYVRNALHDRQFVNVEAMPPALLKRYLVYHSSAWRTVFVVVALVHMLLAMLERPSVFPAYEDDSAGAALAVEILCLVVYAADLWLSFSITPRAAAVAAAAAASDSSRSGSNGVHAYNARDAAYAFGTRAKAMLRRSWPLARLLILIVMVLDVLFVAVSASHLLRFRFSRGLRPFMLVGADR